MGFFGKKEEKEFVSNGKLVEVINNVENYNVLSTLEDEIEKRYLYRNVEKIDYLISGGAIIKYKDLKVRSAMEVEQIKKQLRKEAGLDLGR